MIVEDWIHRRNYVGLFFLISICFRTVILNIVNMWAKIQVWTVAMWACCMEKRYLKSWRQFIVVWMCLSGGLELQCSVCFSGWVAPKDWTCSVISGQSVKLNSVMQLFYFWTSMQLCSAEIWGFPALGVGVVEINIKLPVFCVMVLHIS